MSLKIVVLAGGESSEREVSLRSGKAVVEALLDKGHEVTVLDPKNGLGNIGKPDVVFPALHGEGGEDGTIQSELERLGLLYVGSGVQASELCWDKWQYRQKITSAGVPMAEAELVTVGTFWQSPLVSSPFVLKPAKSGSTIGVHIVRDVKNIDKSKIESDLKRHHKMVLEKLITGTEITVGILGDEALTPVEIIPPKDAEFDYDNKYNGQTQELCPPKNVSTKIQKQAQELALQIHRLTNCRDISRTDMIVTSSEEIYVLETNTLPGMTNQSLYPKAAGMGFPDLCDRLVNLALKH